MKSSFSSRLFVSPLELDVLEEGRISGEWDKLSLASGWALGKKSKAAQREPVTFGAYTIYCNGPRTGPRAWYTLFHLILKTPCDVGTIIMPILKMRKPRHQEHKWFAPSHTDNKWVELVQTPNLQSSPTLLLCPTVPPLTTSPLRAGKDSVERRHGLGHYPHSINTRIKTLKVN